jgi:hypothetical protein
MALEFQAALQQLDRTGATLAWDNFQRLCLQKPYLSACVRVVSRPCSPEARKDADE